MQDCVVIQLDDYRKNVSLLTKKTVTSIKEKSYPSFFECQTNEDKSFRFIWLLLLFAAAALFIGILALDKDILMKMNPDFVALGHAGLQ